MCESQTVQQFMDDNFTDGGYEEEENQEGWRSMMMGDKVQLHQYFCPQ